MLDAGQVKYVVEYAQKPGSRQTVRANQLARPKNLVTKEKVYIIIRLYCEATGANSTWQLSDEAARRHRIGDMCFADIFGGEAPRFEHTFGRGQFSRSHQLNQSRTGKSSPPSAKQQHQQQPQKHKQQASANVAHTKQKSNTPAAAPATAANAKKASKQVDMSDDEANSTSLSSKDPNSELNQTALRIVQILDKKGTLTFFLSIFCRCLRS